VTDHPTTPIRETVERVQTDTTLWKMTFASLMASVEEAVADCAELRSDDPTLPSEVAAYVDVRGALRDHVDGLLARVTALQAENAALREDAARVREQANADIERAVWDATSKLQ